MKKKQQTKKKNIENIHKNISTGRCKVFGLDSPQIKEGDYGRRGDSFRDVPDTLVKFSLLPFAQWSRRPSSLFHFICFLFASSRVPCPFFCLSFCRYFLSQGLSVCLFVCYYVSLSSFSWFSVQTVYSFVYGAHLVILIFSLCVSFFCLFIYLSLSHSFSLSFPPFLSLSLLFSLRHLFTNKTDNYSLASLSIYLSTHLS